MTDNEHGEIKGGWICQATNKKTDFVWNNQDKPGLFNSCPACTGDKRSVGNRLESIEKQQGTGAPARSGRIDDGNG